MHSSGTCLTSFKISRARAQVFFSRGTHAPIFVSHSLRARHVTISSHTTYMSNTINVLYCTVLYGMVWYSMVWYGMVWYGMVWYGIVLHYNVRVNSSREHAPRPNPGHLMHDEFRGPGIWQLIVSRPPPPAFANNKNLLRNILSSFPTTLRVKGSHTAILE